MNRLSQEISPYLKQHEHNPVDWYPWGEEALRKAEQENKPIFLSIGYATCHWCHVMEGDSFEKQDVASILNENFVPVKVDREERPDIDAIYMKAAYHMTGRGGWPLSMALTPRGKPFWGGTFLPREQFKQILSRIADLWTERQQDIEKSADEIIDLLKTTEDKLQQRTSEVDPGLISAFLQKELSLYDDTWGGFGEAPKFPPAMTLLALMRIGRHIKDSKIHTAVKGTLDAMARGGIRDHVGGGFHRYSVDEKWLVPHFEKMLYDNALLSLAYSDAYQLTRSPDYRDVVTTTLDYVIRDMQNPEGGYSSAEDADSEKTEGKFYVWTAEELRQVLSDSEYKFLTNHFPIAEGGNFSIDERIEHLEAAAGLGAVRSANILHQKKDAPLVINENLAYQQLMTKLFSHRAQRVRPLRDDKVLVAWNGLMIGAMAKAHRVLGDRRWLDSAARAADFILTQMIVKGDLQRSYRVGETRYRAYLEDYAGLIFGLIELYEASFDPRWLTSAHELQQKQDQLFWDETEGAYFDTDGKDRTVPIRTKELNDSATPSGNSLAAWNLLRLSAATGNLALEQKAERILLTATDLMRRFATSFPLMMVSLDWISHQHWEYVIATDKKEYLTWPEVCPEFAPHVVFMKSDDRLMDICPNLNGKVKKAAEVVYYLCEKGICYSPSTHALEALRLIRES
jgi:uncharacterized protein YyaL (SSP411 family)